MLTYDTELGGYLVDLDKDQLNDAPRYGESEPDFDDEYGRSVYGYYGLNYPVI